MTTANPQQRQFFLFSKFSSEVRPSVMVQRDERIRTMTSPFEEIAESEEEEDIQIPERIPPEGRSPFAIAFESPFAERRPASPQNLSPTHIIKFPVPRLCHGFTAPSSSRQAPTMFRVLSPERHSVGDFLTLPPIPETASS